MEANKIENKFIKKTLTVKEFAAIYGLGTNKAYELVYATHFPMVKVGKKIIIIASKLDDWFESNIGKFF